MGLIIAGCGVQERIYESPRSIIYRGVRLEDNSPVVIKVLREEYPAPESLAAYQQEYAMLRSLEGRGVIRAYALEPYQQTQAMVLEDFGGRSLREWLEAPEEGRFPAQGGSLSMFLDVAIGIVEGLAAVHQYRIIHKDLNPANILFNPQTGAVRLIDFGISSALPQEGPGLQTLQEMEGTLAYISPEQTGRLSRRLDYRTDFYSLGATFYELLTGRPPFEAADPLALLHAHLALEPIPPHERNSAVPPILSALVMKLLSKGAEARYQSAWGLRADLLECRQQWEERGAIEPFPLGRWDFIDTLQVPQRLYGRESETAALLEAFARVSQGARELFLVTGYAGTGKSSLIDAVHGPMTAQRGYFCAGKFELYQRAVPYTAFRQAFDSLCDQWLSAGTGELEQLRARILEAVGPNARILIDVIPRLALVLGAQPPAPALDSQESAQRFSLVFQQFIQAVAQPEQPLVLFLDDLQWADSASLKLLGAILSAVNGQYLLILGAYRSNEVDAAHPLVNALDDLRQSGAAVTTLPLRDLTPGELTAFLAEALGCAGSCAASLALLLHEKTGGNPFFALEFLKMLVAEGLLRFNYAATAVPESFPEEPRWLWDLEAIQTRTITDNVVDLLQRRIAALPEATQAALRLAAAIGAEFDLRTLAWVARQSGPEAMHGLWPAVLAGLVVPLDGSYRLARIAALSDSAAVRFKFQHDRVHQAAESLLPEDERPGVHLQIGRLLRADLPAEGESSALFTAVNHLNAGAALIDDPQERLQLAALDLRAGRQADAATAFEAALEYFEAGMRCLAAEGWETDYTLALSLHSAAAGAAYAGGAFERAEALIAAVLAHGRTLLDKIPVYEVQLRLDRVRNRWPEAIRQGVQVLRALGEPFPRRPHSWDVALALLRTRMALRGRSPEALAALPPMRDPTRQAALRIITILSGIAYLVEPNLMPLLVLRQISLSLKYGNDPHSITGYAAYGLMLCAALGDVESGERMGRLALTLLDRLDANRLRAQVQVIYNTLYHWKGSIHETLPKLLEGYQSGLEHGDLEFLSYAISLYLSTRFLVGKNLAEVAGQYEIYNPVIAQFRQQAILETNHLYQQAVLNFIGHSATPARLSGAVYDSEAAEMPGGEPASNPNLLFSIHMVRLILGYWFGELPRALEAYRQVQRYTGAVFGTMSIPLIHFYGALVLLAHYPAAGSVERRALLRTVNAYQKKLHRWAQDAPENYQHKFDLVAAERCRVLGQEGAARMYYDRAIAGAAKHGYLNEEALGWELAGRFYFERPSESGWNEVARFYLRRAHHACRRWGAQAKVQALESQYPELLLSGEVPFDPDGRPRAVTEPFRGRYTEQLLDLTSMMKLSQAISSEIVLEKLQTRLMQVVMENAGGQAAALLLVQGSQWQVAARANSTGASDIRITLMHAEPTEAELPLSLIHYVARTQNSVVLRHAGQEGPFRRDPYLLAAQVKSVLCMPLANQGRLVGILYLENNRMAGAFTEERLKIFELLATQSAIAIENAQLYSRLEERVAERTAELSEANQALQQYTRALEARNTELDAFAHTVAHDLKTPLTSLVGFSALLARRLDRLSPEAIQADLLAIQRSGRKMTAIVNELLLLTSVRKMEEIAIGPLDMAAIVDEALERFQEPIQETRAEIVVPPVWPTAQGYGPWVEEVWVNYISNGLKYGGRPEEQRPPRLELGYDLAESEGVRPLVRFWVRDNGPGLAPQAQERLFTLFTRLDQGRAEGHGLGLSIVQRIVTRLGGTAGVESRVGEGSRFYFTLPVDAGSLARLPFHREAPKAAPVPVSAPAAEPPPPVPTLSALPEVWRAEMRQAAVEGDLLQMQLLAMQIQPQAPELAAHLLRLIDQFDNQAILTLLGR